MSSTREQLANFGREVAEILASSEEDWGEAELDRIAAAAVRCGVDLSKHSGDED